jgi:hypothetical protein
MYLQKWTKMVTTEKVTTDSGKRVVRFYEQETE